MQEKHANHDNHEPAVPSSLPRTVVNQCQPYQLVWTMESFQPGNHSVAVVRKRSKEKGRNAKLRVKRLKGDRSCSIKEFWSNALCRPVNKHSCSYSCSQQFLASIWVTWEEPGVLSRGTTLLYEKETARENSAERQRKYVELCAELI